MKFNLLHNSFRFSPAAVEGGTKEQISKGTSKPDEKKPDDKSEDKKKEEEEDLEKMTAEELRAKQKELKDMTRGRRAKVEKPAEAKPKEEAKAEKPPEKKAETKPEAKAEEKPAPVKKVEAKAEHVGEIPPPIGNVAQQPEDAAPKAPELKTEMELTPADKRKLRVIQEMEEDGSTPKGTAQKLLKFWEKEAKYVEEWQKANPGKAFDEDAEDHQGFYEQNEVTYDADSFDIARDSLVRKEAKSEIDGDRKKERQRDDRLSEFKAAQPKFSHDANAAVIDMIVAASPELAELLGPEGERAITKEAHEKMVAKDPVVTEILQETAEELAVLSMELQRLTQFDDVYPAKPQKAHDLNVAGRRIYPHSLLLDFMVGLEKELVSMDPSKTMKGGKRLVSNGQYNAEADRIARGEGSRTEKQRSLDGLNAKYYTLTEADFQRGLVASYAAKAKTEVERFNRRHGFRTPKTETITQPPPKQEEKEKPEDAEVVPERRKSPSTSSPSDIVDNGKNNAQTPEELRKAMIARSRGR